MLWCLVACLGSLSVLGSCEDNTFVPPPPPSVTVANPLVKDVTTFVELTGYTEPFREVEVRARVEGILIEALTNPGQRVEEGELLFRIDPDLFTAHRDAASALVEKAAAELELATVRLERVEQVARQGAATDIELLEARARVNMGSADLKVAQRELAIRQLSVDYTQVRAPISGEIQAGDPSLGSLVGSGGTTLLTRMYDTSKVYAWMAVSDRIFLSTARRDSPADGPLAYPIELATEVDVDYPYSGVIDYIDPMVDTATGTIRVRAVFDNPTGVLRGGLFVRCRIVAGDTSDAILLPETAIGSGQSGRYVLVVGEGDVVEVRPVVLGPQEGAFRVIEAGVRPDDRVITEGLLRARPGQPVVPKLTTLVSHARDESTGKPAQNAQSDSSGVPSQGAE
jgi:RND family efflux transporter MFP subunit